MNKDLIAFFEYLEREKGIKRELVISAIEEALQAAARKSVAGASNITVNIHPKTGDINVYCEKEIVDEVDTPSQQILLEDARELDPECELGQFIDVVVTPKDFGRVAAQKARQIIGQKLRGAERDVIHEEYRHRANELISGTVKRFVRGANLIIDLGKVEAIMPMRNYPKTETFHVGDKVLALLIGVIDTENGGAEVVLSRSSPEFVRQLVIQEVPEINEGIVEITSIVRDPGYRTKLVVRSTDSKVDPVGACVGMRGSRVKNIVRELNNEKIDIIPFSSDAVELLQNALSPIEVRKVNVNDESRVMSIVVDDDDFAAVIGKQGKNARLNGLLIDYDLEVQRMSEYNRAMIVQRAEMASATDPYLDEPLDRLEGLNDLTRTICRNLIDAGYPTARALLLADPTSIRDVSLPMVEMILQQIGKQRK
jgi:N utilization substance protein A